MARVVPEKAVTGKDSRTVRTNRMKLWSNVGRNGSNWAIHEFFEQEQSHGIVGNFLIGGSWLLAGICFPCAITEGVQIVQEYERAVIFRRWFFISKP